MTPIILGRGALVDPRDFERRLPKVLALVMMFGVASVGWVAIWFATGFVMAGLAALL